MNIRDFKVCPNAVRGLIIRSYIYSTGYRHNRASLPVVYNVLGGR